MKMVFILAREDGHLMIYTISAISAQIKFSIMIKTNSNVLIAQVAQTAALTLKASFLFVAATMALH